jgi:hypothetical protein
LLDNFVHVFQYLNNLWHHNNSFNNLFKDIWDFDKFFLMRNDGDREVNDSINNLQYFLNMVDISNHFLEFFHDNNLLDKSVNLSNSFIFVSKFNNFLVFSNNLFELFDYYGYFDDLFNDTLDVSVDIYQLRDYSFDFNNFWHFYDLFLCDLDLVDSWDNC